MPRQPLGVAELLASRADDAEHELELRLLNGRPFQRAHFFFQRRNVA